MLESASQLNHISIHFYIGSLCALSALLLLAFILIHRKKFFDVGVTAYEWLILGSLFLLLSHITALLASQQMALLSSIINLSLLYPILTLFAFSLWIYAFSLLIDNNSKQYITLLTGTLVFITGLIGFIALNQKLLTLPSGIKTFISSPVLSLIYIIIIIIASSTILMYQILKRKLSSFLFFYTGIHLFSLPLFIHSLQSKGIYSETGHYIWYVSINFFACFFFLAGSFVYKPPLPTAKTRKNKFNLAVCWLLVVIAISLLVSLSSTTIAISNGSNNSSTITNFLISIFLISIVAIFSQSRDIRQNIAVIFNKNFLKHKYDYRKVWLNLIHTLSNISEEDNFFELSLKAVGDIFEADGGALWLYDNNQQLELHANWNVISELEQSISFNEEFIEPFVEDEWIYSLNSSGNEQHDKHQHILPDWIRNIENIWVVAPLMIGQKLVGFFLLTKSKLNEALIWEDIDVLKSTGRQLSSYIIRQVSAEELAESKQFDTYNKLTAFIMHDLKNLIAQQALVVENAKKHKENPAFVEDAIRTIDNSVRRMSHLLKRLQRNTHQAAHKPLAVKTIILEAIKKCSDRQPLPTLRGDAENAHVLADHDQIVLILMHIIRNAQDATSNDGFIDVNLVHQNTTIKIEIEDNGCGMDEDFLKNRLFKPFDSTKSSMGMGIGAYQVREFIHAMNGEIDVKSEVDIGTSITVTLPLVDKTA